MRLILWTAGLDLGFLSLKKLLEYMTQRHSEGKLSNFQLKLHANAKAVKIFQGSGEIREVSLMPRELAQEETRRCHYCKKSGH
jgi:hypothetical protein